MDIPLALAFEVLAALVECALKVFVSIPTISIMVLSHLAMVDVVPGLCGAWKDINNYELVFSVLFV